MYGGDFNARVGASQDEDDINGDILGYKLDINDRNENGGELLLFCHNNDMAVINSFFSYNHCTGTWPPSEFKFALDHVLMNKKSFRNSVISAGVRDNYELPTNHGITTVSIKQQNLSNDQQSSSKGRKRKREGKRNVLLLVTNEEVAKRYRCNMEKEMDLKNLITQFTNDGSINVENVIDEMTK